MMYGMSLLARFTRCERRSILGHSKSSWPIQRPGRFRVTTASYSIQTINVPELSYAKQSHHVFKVAKQLQQSGILKVSLNFSDANSDYLKHLISALHHQHGHQVPISHSALQGPFWDVRPSDESLQGKDFQARSETMEEFPWHTDCSYEDQPPRYFALHVLQHDRKGGGMLSLMNAKSLSEHLSSNTLASLRRPEYHIKVPPEFAKDPDRKSIIGCILAANDEYEEVFIRYRKDLLTGLSQRASQALDELDTVLGNRGTRSVLTVDILAEDLPKGTVILINNRRWLHARSRINDPQRHLRRVRWDAVPFQHSDDEQNDRSTYATPA